MDFDLLKDSLSSKFNLDIFSAGLSLDPSSTKNKLNGVCTSYLKSTYVSSSYVAACEYRVR